MATSLSSLSKILTKSKPRSHGCSTSTTISTSHSLQTQFWSRHFSAVADSSFSTSAAALGTQTSSPSPPKDNKRGSKWSRLLLFLPGVITFGLGSWQVVRREEKIKTLEYQQQRLKLEPVQLNTEHPPDENLDALEFRRVSCKGVFDEKKSIYLGPRSRSISGVTENGFYVITPLMPIPGGLDSLQSPILVNRGWVPRSWRDKPPESTEADFIANESTEAKPVSHEQSSWWKFWSKVITKVGLVIM